MRVNKITCTHCQATLTSKAGVEVGASLICPKCKKKFTIEAPEEEVIDDFEVVDEEEEEAPKKKPTPAKKPRDEDDNPKAKKKSRDDDEEDKPKAKKKSRSDDDDEEEKPRKKKKKKRDDDDDDDDDLSAYGKLKKNVYVRVGVLGVLLTIFGVLAYYKIKEFNKASDSSSTPAATKDEDEDLAKPIKLDPNRPKVEPKKKAAPKIDNRLVGRWKFQDDDGTKPFIVLVFNADGTFSETANIGTPKRTINGTWAFERPGPSNSPQEIVITRKTGTQSQSIVLHFDTPDSISYSMTYPNMEPTKYSLERQK